MSTMPSSIMDATPKDEIPNPKNRANLFSKLFFIWIIGLFRRTLKTPLQIADLCKVLSSDQSDQLGNKLEENWNKEIIRAKCKNEKPRLINAIKATFLWKYMLFGGILFVQHVILRSFQPMVLGYLISLFGNDATDYKTMYISAGTLIITNFFIVLSMHHAVFGQSSIGMRIRIAVSSLIFRKTMKLDRKALNQTSVGQIINLLANDVTRFDLVVLTLHYLWILPFQAAVVTFLSWTQVGFSSLVGVTSIALLSLPVQGYLGKLTSNFRTKVAERCDRRVTLMSEIISGIQVIKMYAWETAFEKFVHLVRLQEMKALTITSYLRGIYLSFMIFVERTALFLTLTCHVLSGNVFLPEQVFSVSQFFNLLQLTMAVFYPLAISYGAEALVAVERIEKFLMMEEIEAPKTEIDSRKGISLSGVCASWEKPLLKEITFEVPRGSLCAVVGPTGAGKTSLLQLLLNELTPTSGKIKIQGTISFASQEPWLFAATIRNNILFGSEYNKKLYSKIVKICALQKDFDQFPLADKTLVGERGATLSGGQRARINLARCVYRNADVYLLDDPLSSVDNHVSKHLFDECIVKYLHGKTRILVTHQLQHLRNVDNIVVINNGKVEAQGSYEELFEKNLYCTNPKKSESVDDLKLTSSDNFLIESIHAKNNSLEGEEIGTRKTSSTLFLYVGASKNIFLICVVAIMLVICQVLCSGIDYWVTFWTQEEVIRRQNLNESLIIEEYYPQDVKEVFPVNHAIIATHTAVYIYLGLIVSCIVVAIIRSFLYFKLAMKTSKNLHDQILTNLLQASMKFFNTNPAGRILNRFSKDMGAVDEILPKVLLEALQIGLTMCGILVMVIVSNYYMIPVTIILGFVFMKIRTWFVAVTKHVKHLEGISKSPVFSHLNSSLQGITTIRAFGAVQKLRKEFDHHQDVHTSAWFLLITAISSFGLWLDLICLTFIACTSFSFIFLTHYNQIDGSLVGLAISQSLILTGMLQYGVRQSAEVVNQLTSVERILQYEEIEKEIQSSSENLPPHSWPDRGFILLENLHLRYSPTEPFVLKNLNAEIQAGSKIGIVGRTGAGKSTLISALFRLNEISGSIYIDGVDTQTVDIHRLRKNLSIIPQEPAMFSTTLRQNLDPFREFDDLQLWKALEEVELKNTVSSLDVPVLRGGANFSVGQRQLICLARAILKNNKILIMDEATANADEKTDALIQKMIRKKFQDCTVLTIAHRLHTVMDSDKVMVMDNGKIMEYDHPYLLLQDSESIFTRMVVEAGEMRNTLEIIALEAFLSK